MLQILKTWIGTVRTAEKAKEIEALGYKNVKLLILDITLNDAQFKQAFKDLEALTPNGIDVIVHNIGVTVSHKYVFSTLEEYPEEEYDQVYDVNVRGSARFYRAICPRLETNGKPVKILFISSLAARISQMDFATGPYGASKAALNNLIKQMAIQRAAKNDIVIPIHPGLVDTDMAAPIRHLEVLQPMLITPDESIRQMLAVIDKLTLQDTGKFFSYDGSVLEY